MTKSPLLLTLALMAAPLLAQAPVATAAAQTIAPGTHLRVELETKIDSKKAKVGDKITAKADENLKDGDNTLLPKGAVLTGAITQVTPAGDKNTPALGIEFTSATTKQGNTFTFRATVVQIVEGYDNSNNMLSHGPEMGGGQLSLNQGGGPATMAMATASNGAPINFTLQDTAVESAQGDLGGIISSVHGNFTLDDGTKLQLQILQPH